MRILFSVLVTLAICVCTSHAGADGKYSFVLQRLQAAQKLNQKNSKLFSIGKNDAGDEIWGIKIGSGEVSSLVVGTHHGNEFGSTEVAVSFAEETATKPLANQTVYVIPVLNISGFNRNGRQENIGSTTLDPNRDYPGPCTEGEKFRLKSTQLLAKFVEAHDIVSVATLHTFKPAVVYPWGFATEDLSTPYDADFRKLCEDATFSSGYKIGNSAEVIYPANGTFEDYVFWRHGVWGLLFELGNTHNPNKYELDELREKNLPGIRKFLENSPVERAKDHAFHGKCNPWLSIFDLQDE